MQRAITRRQFLRSAGAAGVGVMILNNPLSARTFAANEKVNVALVGVTGRGRWFVEVMPRLANVAALCDVNEYRARATFEAMPDVPKFADFRVMLDKMDRQIDGVVVATPDNTHAVIGAAAIRHGKGVFIEKPMAHDVYEARMLRQLARQHNVATQMGNQGTSSEAMHRAMAIIRSGVIGPVREVYVFATQQSSTDRPETPPVDVPAALEWDLWLGPAAYRPYNPAWMRWHAWRELGTCALGNWGTHASNLAFMALGLDRLWHADPSTRPLVRLRAEYDGFSRERFPRWEKVHYEFPARGDLPPVSLHWSNSAGAPGVRQTIETIIQGDLDWGDKREKRWADHAGCVIIGTEGVVHATSHCTSFRLRPESKFRDYKGPEGFVHPSQGHDQDWLAAVKGGRNAWSNFEYSGPQTEFLMLGNIVTQFEPGTELQYDPLAGSIVNNAEADRLLRRQYRDGWAL